MKRQFSILSLAAAIVVISGVGAPAYANETLTDRCSGDVVIKVPYADGPSLDDKDIVLARSEAMCRLVEGNPPAFTGVCQHDPKKNSAFTATIAYSSIKNGDRRFRWFCGKTAERSRCEEGTKQVRFLIGPDRLFRTVCLH